jgi:UDP-N-acetylmuramate dehydrogenase
MSEKRLVIRAVQLNKYSSFAIGGEANYFAEPSSFDALFEVIKYCAAEGLRPIFFGYGSNLLFPDEPSPTACFISLKRLNSVDYNGNYLKVSCGVPVSFLSFISLMAKQDNFQFTYLLPGSIGAATYINARYFEQEMSQIIATASYLDLDNISLGMQTIKAEKCEFSYKKSIFQRKNWLIIEIEIPFKVPSTVVEEVNIFLTSLNQMDLDEMVDLSKFEEQQLHLKETIIKARPEIDQRIFSEIELQRGKYKHFSYPSVGSIFKNHRELGAPIGKIVDELGMKGLQVGGATISPHHGNIIVNTGGAKAEDVLSLIDKIASAIEERYGFRPEAEISIIK